MERDPNCIFCRIAAKEVPAKIVYEDDAAMVFHDINPVAEVHLLAIPKRHIVSTMDLTDADVETIGKVMVAATKAAKMMGLTDGWRTIINTGRIGRQEVMHLHVHVIGGTKVLPAMIKW